MNIIVCFMVLYMRADSYVIQIPARYKHLHTNSEQICDLFYFLLRLYPEHLIYEDGYHFKMILNVIHHTILPDVS